MFFVTNLLISRSTRSTNAAIAVPWAIVGATAVGGILGTALNIVLAFCAGTDIDSIVNNKIGQPMATVLFNSLGQHGTLILWSFIVLVQYQMGSSMVCCVLHGSACNQQPTSGTSPMFTSQHWLATLMD